MAKKRFSNGSVFSHQLKLAILEMAIFSILNRKLEPIERRPVWEGRTGW